MAGQWRRRLGDHCLDRRAGDNDDASNDDAEDDTDDTSNDDASQHRSAQRRRRRRRSRRRGGSGSSPAATASAPTAASSRSGCARRTPNASCSSSRAAAPASPRRRARSTATPTSRSIGAGRRSELDEPGIFDLDDPRNPFADWSMVYVPYCTGDLHLGTVTTPYSPTLTVQHKGFVNGTAALDALASTFPDATEIVVAGESAGAAPAPLYAGLAADRLPDASVTVLADGAGSYPDQPGDQCGNRGPLGHRGNDPGLVR